MPWTYEHNPVLQIIDVVYAGNITARDLRESTSELIALGKEKGINRFLLDTTEMKLDTNLVDLYDLPTQQYVEEKADRQGRIAVILPKSTRARKAAEFFETVCRNRGWLVQVFSERQGAVDWLTLSSPSNKPHAGDGS